MSARRPVKIATPRFPRGRELEQLLAELRDRPNVVGCMVGRERKEGRLTRRVALIACVSEKVPARRLSAAHRIPPGIEWKAGRAARLLPTDVQIQGESGRHAAAIEPGDAISPPALTTVGVALEHPRYGDVVTTAGHAFLDGPGMQEFAPGTGPTVDVTVADPDSPGATISATPLKAVIDGDVDYAILSPVAGAAVRNRYGGVPLGDAYTPDAGDVGSRVFALTAGGARPAVLTGVNADVEVAGVQTRGCIVTDWVTRDGDSGCPLVDARGRVLGLLKGWAYFDAVVHSIWMSVNWPVSREQARLI